MSPFHSVANTSCRVPGRTTGELSCQYNSGYYLSCQLFLLRIFSSATYRFHLCFPLSRKGHYCLFVCLFLNDLKKPQVRFHFLCEEIHLELMKPEDGCRIQARNTKFTVVRRVQCPNTPGARGFCQVLEAPRLCQDIHHAFGGSVVP